MVQDYLSLTIQISHFTNNLINEKITVMNPYRNFPFTSSRITIFYERYLFRIFKSRKNSIKNKHKIQSKHMAVSRLKGNLIILKWNSTE